MDIDDFISIEQTLSKLLENNRLTELDVVILSLYFSGFSIKEIAEKTGKTRQTISNKLDTTVQLLREEIICDKEKC